MKCAVLNCHTDYKVKASECSLFSFPVNPVLRKEWIQFCRQNKDYNFSTAYICMEHFVREDFENIVQFEMGFAKKRILKREAVPSIYKPSDANPERSQRVQRRRNKEIVDELLRQSEESTSHEGGICS
ncbi:PREDICTED: THAP domain-containing protein 2-like, partial [Rhagoletis zephyria]|uniref:THAP domain-containing protein 2-like n=1 Tax=Rhagoletis zephyria TaxID=28612 RepID=UPI0008115D28